MDAVHILRYYSHRLLRYHRKMQTQKLFRINIYARTIELICLAILYPIPPENFQDNTDSIY